MKRRLDELLVQKGLAPSRSQAKLLIKEGKVFVSEEPAKKPSQVFEDDAEIGLTTDEQYVSRGAYKLKEALEKFNIDPKNKVVLDIGASTGGFSDLLLQRGAKHCICVDVGNDQLHPKLLNHPQITNLENTDIRNIKELPQSPDLVVMDLSFISLRLVLPHLKVIVPRVPIIALFKPQFEAGPKLIPKDGVIKDPEILKLVATDFKSWCSENSFEIVKKTPSPIKGKGGNQEYLIWIRDTALDSDSHRHGSN